MIPYLARRPRPSVGERRHYCSRQPQPQGRYPNIGLLRPTKGLVHTLCVKPYNTDNSLLCTGTILCHIYQNALRNDFHNARDMLLVSRLSDQSTTPTPVLKSSTTAPSSSSVSAPSTLVSSGSSEYAVGDIRHSTSQGVSPSGHAPTGVPNQSHSETSTRENELVNLPFTSASTPNFSKRLSLFSARSSRSRYWPGGAEADAVSKSSGGFWLS